MGTEIRFPHRASLKRILQPSSLRAVRQSCGSRRRRSSPSGIRVSQRFGQSKRSQMMSRWFIKVSSSPCKGRGLFPSITDRILSFLSKILTAESRRRKFCQLKQASVQQDAGIGAHRSSDIARQVITVGDGLTFQNERMEYVISHNANSFTIGHATRDRKSVG